MKHDPAYDEWANACNAIQARVDEACDAAGHQSTVVFYSAYPHDGSEERIPVDNLDEAVAEGEFYITAVNSPFWGEGEDYKSGPITNPTWMDVAVAANASIPVTGDNHHRFLEGINKQDDCLEMYFGS